MKKKGVFKEIPVLAPSPRHWRKKLGLAPGAEANCVALMAFQRRQNTQPLGEVVLPFCNIILGSLVL